MSTVVSHLRDKDSRLWEGDDQSPNSLVFKNLYYGSWRSGWEGPPERHQVGKENALEQYGEAVRKERAMERGRLPDPEGRSPTRPPISKL